MTFNVYGRAQYLGQDEYEQIRDAGSPVRCRCGQIYDLQAVEVTASFADATVFTTPCCRQQADDRPWVNHFTRIDKREVLGR